MVTVIGIRSNPGVLETSKSGVLLLGIPIKIINNIGDMK